LVFWTLNRHYFFEFLDFLRDAVNVSVLLGCGPATFDIP
jgi:hypothetical protein